MSTVERAYEEIIDFFARGSTSAEVLQFRPSIEAQQRARYLLDRSKTGELTPDEVAELHRLGDVEHLMQLVKAQCPQVCPEQIVTSHHISAPLRRRIRERAHSCCEYCLDRCRVCNHE